MIVPGPPKGIEPDYPYNEDTMFRIVKEPVEMTMTYAISGSVMTLHYNSQDASVAATLVHSSSDNTIIIPASVTEFFLKQVNPGATLGWTRVSGPNITEVTWNPELKAQRLIFWKSSKLTKVSPYLPKEVVTLENSLRECPVFNQDLSSWDTSSVTNMNNMFYNSTGFNGDISSWNTGNLTTMQFLLYGCRIFNRDLSGWDVSKVINSNSYDTNATAWQADFKPKFT